LAVSKLGAVCGLPGAVLPRCESAASTISHITLGEKPTGQPSTGNPYAGLDEAGAGNVAMGAGLRPTTKGVDEPPDPKARAPVLDPTEVAGDGNQDSRVFLSHIPGAIP